MLIFGVSFSHNIAKDLFELLVPSGNTKGMRDAHNSPGRLRKCQSISRTQHTRRVLSRMVNLSRFELNQWAVSACLRKIMAPNNFLQQPAEAVYSITSHVLGAPVRLTVDTNCGWFKISPYPSIKTEKTFMELPVLEEYAHLARWLCQMICRLEFEYACVSAQGA